MTAECTNNVHVELNQMELMFPEVLCAIHAHPRMGVYRSLETRLLRDNVLDQGAWEESQVSW